MMRRRRHARLPPASGAAGGDTDALQTDVMRFMSIIGLCLMAIFALVQGLPVQEQGKPPSQAAGIRQEIRAQQQQLQELQVELHALQSSRDRTQQLLTVAQQHREQLAGQTQQAVKPVIEKQSPPVPAAKPDPARQGLILRFASAAALDRLVTAGSVTLYGMADQQAWRLSMDAGRPAAAQTAFPGWFHEMSALTVPAHYIHSLEKAADGPGQSTVVWGVQLPAATRTAIASLTREQQGGALVIRGDGRVTLEE